jgi:hypothetical protein
MEAVVEEAGGGYPDGSLIGGDWKQEDLGVAERNFAGLSAIGAGGGAKGKQYGALFFLAALVAVLSGGFGFPVEQRGVGAGGAGETRAGDFGNVGAGFRESDRPHGSRGFPGGIGYFRPARGRFDSWWLCSIGVAGVSPGDRISGCLTGFRRCQKGGRNRWRRRDPVWSEYRIALIPWAGQALHFFATPAEFAFRAATGAAKRGADVADHAADAPIPDAAHTSGV